MRVIESERVTVVDCDDTLILWDKSEYDPESYITISAHGHDSVVVPHEANIKLFKKFAKLGYTMIVWSQSGYAWAEAVVKALGLEDMVTLCMSKPRYYFDDIPCEEWMGPRIWRDPKS